MKINIHITNTVAVFIFEPKLILRYFYNILTHLNINFCNNYLLSKFIRINLF